MDCVRGIDFLCSREEINKKKIAVFGGSQGGGLSFATAALDQRVSLCAPVVPFLAHWKKYFKTSDWPEMNEWVESKKERTWERTLKTLSYFDSMNLATRIQCPVFMGVGLQDPVCPPATNFAALNHTKGQKKISGLCPCRTFAWGHSPGTGPRLDQGKFQTLRKACGFQDFLLLVIKRPTVTPRKVTIMAGPHC